MGKSDTNHPRNLDWSNSRDDQQIGKESGFLGPKWRRGRISSHGLAISPLSRRPNAKPCPLGQYTDTAVLAKS
jgi:hypothetical protein